MRILLVEDDKVLAVALSRRLRAKLSGDSKSEECALV
jgi:DNA-binding response OmpR family regulator